ncbi:MAG: hypothetical protein IKC69_02920 [Clostridia bacterium]|nr:hypothetical protein [Clostridia bacterium]
MIIGLILGLAYFLYYIFWLKPNAQYRDGLAQIEDEEWDAAILIFEDLKNFRNSKAKLMESLAGKGTELAEEEKFEEAYGYFDRIHEVHNSLKSSKQNEYRLDYQISVYKYGEALLLDEGMERKAAVKFGIAIGWEDAKERAFALWNETRTVKHVEIGIRLGAVSNAYEGVVILRTDGTVVSQHGSPDFQKTISEWTDIVEIAACHNYLAAINSQGDMFVANYYTSGKTFDDQWTNIADIDSYETHDVLYAVRADGRVMFSDDDNLTQYVGAWEGQEVTQVSVGQNSIAGLTTNGTALYWNRNNYSYNSSESTGIESWTDLVQVEMGDNYVYALKSDGTVVTNNLNLFDELATWENVKEIRLTSRVAWGLTESGTLLGTDKTKDAEWRSRSGISEFAAFTDKLITVNENGKLSPYNYGEFTEDSINP